METRPDPLTDLLLQTGKAVAAASGCRRQVAAGGGRVAFSTNGCLTAAFPGQALRSPKSCGLLFDDAHAGRILAQH